MQVMHSDYDLLIIGAGPAGATLALKMAGSGLRIGVVEKEINTGNKICGDALGGMVFSVMKRLPGKVFEDFISCVPHIASHGIRFTAPNHVHADIPFNVTPGHGGPPPGCLCLRSDFDSFLNRKLQSTKGIALMRGVKVSHLQINDTCVTVETTAGTMTSGVVAGADGVHSVVRRSLLPGKIPPRHVSVGIRAYFKGVAANIPGNHIELIFLKKVLPGYFWIFPLPGGLVNAGFGLLQKQVLHEKTSMTALFDELIRRDPLLAPRFSNAAMIGKPGAHILPLGTFTPPRSGNRLLLLGDAASLVDPFSGEGIGNAMASAETAAAVLTDCFQSDDFSAASLNTYDRKIERRFGPSFRTSGIMQRLAVHAGLLNFVIGKVSRNEELRNLFTAMYTNESIREKLRKPSFYAGLLFK